MALDELDQKSLSDRGFSNLRQTKFADRPELYKAYQEMVKKAGLGFEPELYVGDYKHPATTSLLIDPKIAISQPMLDLMDDKEMAAVLGHELGHIKNRIKQTLLMNADKLAIAPAVGVISGVASFIFLGKALAELDKKKPGEDDKKIPRRDFFKRVARFTGKALAATAIGGSIGTGAAKTSGPTVRQWAGEHNENEADLESLLLSGDKTAAISAAKKLDKYFKDNNLSVSTLHGHASFSERIQRMEEARASVDNERSR